MAGDGINDAPAKPVLLVRLQCRGRADRGRVLCPWFGTLLSSMIARAAMSFGPVAVIGNSLR